MGIVGFVDRAHDCIVLMVTAPQSAAVVSHVCRLNVFFLFVDMARGQQKIQSQQKNAKKQAEQKKKQGHDQKAAAKAALIYTCTVCRVRGTEVKIVL